jgi:MYXO-CTERM domain-containing protein
MKTSTGSCVAMGALLFGGTLGAAHANVVGIAGNSSSALLSLAYDFSSYQSFGAYGSPMAGSVSFSDPTYGSIAVSQFTGGGFSMQINSTAAANNQSFYVSQLFTTTDAVNVSLSGFAPVSSSNIALTLCNSDGSLGAFIFQTSDAGSFNYSGQLAATTGGQYYRFLYTSAASDATSGTLFDLSFTAVPSPGAAALIGLAGLAARRRRA